MKETIHCAEGTGSCTFSLTNDFMACTVTSSFLFFVVVLLCAEIRMFTNLGKWVLRRNTVTKVTYRTSERGVTCFEMYEELEGSRSQINK